MGDILGGVQRKMISAPTENGKKVLTMAEYIEREALMRRIKEIHCAECDSYHGARCRACWVDDTLDYIDSEPAADVEPVQEWISIEDKLPEVVSIHKGYRSTVKKSIRVLCVCVQKSGKTMVKEGYCEWYNDYQEPRWQIPGTIDEVTHWQYLPHPPKGE